MDITLNSIVLQSVWGFPTRVCHRQSPHLYSVLSCHVSRFCWCKGNRNCVDDTISVGLLSQPRKQPSTQPLQPPVSCWMPFLMQPTKFIHVWDWHGVLLAFAQWLLDPPVAWLILVVDLKHLWGGNYGKCKKWEDRKRDILVCSKWENWSMRRSVKIACV